MAISESNVDAGTDSPRLARTQIHEAIQLLNIHEYQVGTYANLWKFLTLSQMANAQAGVTTDDLSTNIQAAIDTGLPVRCPTGTYRYSTVDLNVLGQIFFGDGEAATTFVITAGGQGFRVRARNVTVHSFRIIPTGTYLPGTQSNVVADCFTIKEAASDENYVEAFKMYNISCYNVKGCAIRMISPLRESHIFNNRFHGMGNGATDDGIIHMDNPSTSDRSPNILWIHHNSVYRFAAPFINFKVSGSSATGRDQPPFADIYITWNLIHGQLVDENAVPSPLTVMAEQTHHIYIKGCENVVVKYNKFAATHPNFHGVRIEPFLAYAINKAVEVDENYMSYSLTVPATTSPTGGYVRVTDSINTTMGRNKVAAGYFTYDFDARDSGGHSSNLVTNFLNNESLNQYQPTYNYPDWATIAEPGSLKMTHTTPQFVFNVPGSSARSRMYADGAGSWHIECDPSNSVSASVFDVSIDGNIILALDKDGVFTGIKYFMMTPVSAGSTPNRAQFLDSSNDKMSYKNAGGVVSAYF